MANIALVTANRINVVQSYRQLTLPAAEAIVAGAPVRLDTATGRWTNSNGSSAGEARTKGVATKNVQAGEGLTAIQSGIMDGYDLTALAYDAPVYVSDTDGRLGDAAGTVSVVAGRVIPGFATTLGTAADKLLEVNFPV
jgi:hypothetical protein